MSTRRYSSSRDRAFSEPSAFEEFQYLFRVLSENSRGLLLTQVALVGLYLYMFNSLFANLPRPESERWHKMAMALLPQVVALVISVYKPQYAPLALGAAILYLAWIDWILFTQPVSIVASYSNVEVGVLDSIWPSFKYWFFPASLLKKIENEPSQYLYQSGEPRTRNQQVKVVPYNVSDNDYATFVNRR